MNKAERLIGMLLGETEEGYVTKVQDVSVPSPSDQDISIDNAEATVHWTLDMEARSWGIKDILPTIHKIEISYTEERWSDQAETKTPKTLVFPMEGFEIVS